jgi:serine/threonine-protein kinase RsbT
MAEMISIKVENETDIFFIQNELTKVIKLIGFGLVDEKKIKVIVSELAYNIIKYASRGFIRISQLEERGKRGVVIKATDKGPGIDDIDKALQDNYSTSGTLGLGLPGIKRMADELKINSSIDKGTEVIVKYFINE